MNTLTVTLYNRILSIFNLEIVGGKLFYMYKLHYGNIPLLISNLTTDRDINRLTYFLELPYTPWSNDIDELYYCLTNSLYFNKSVFLEYYTIDEEYNKFKEFINKYDPIEFRYNHEPSTIIVHKIDEVFNTNILTKITNLKEQNLTNKTIKINFNGHLVLKWIPELHPGKLLKETIDEFKEHIEKRFSINFLKYLVDRPPNMIRKDFLFYYYDDFNFYEMEYTNIIPFYTI